MYFRGESNLSGGSASVDGSHASFFEKSHKSNKSQKSNKTNKSNTKRELLQVSQQRSSNRLLAQENKRVSMATTSDEFQAADEETQEAASFADWKRTAIRCFRFLVVLLLFGMTIAASLITLKILNENEERKFKAEFTAVADNIQGLSDKRMSKFVEEFETFAWTISGLAINSNSTWPFFTDANSFHTLATNFLDLVDSHLVALAPLVHNATERKQWTKYSVDHQGWVDTGYTFQKEQPIKRLQSVDAGNQRRRQRRQQVQQVQYPQLQQQQQQEAANNNNNNNDDDTNSLDSVPRIYPDIFRIVDGSPAPARDNDGPFLPVWQLANLPQKPSMVNFNVFENGPMVDAYEQVQELQSPVLADLANTLIRSWGELFDRSDLETNPVSIFFHPVFQSSSDKTIVALLLSELEWLPQLRLASDEETPPVDIVVDDGCQRQMTFEVRGPHIALVGHDDHHDTQFTKYQQSFEFAPFLPTRLVSGPQCSYTIRIFPTQEFFDTYHTSNPATHAGTVGAIFCFACIVFFLYDAAVNRRQRRLLKLASRSDQILSVLYPKTIRDRLFGMETTTHTPSAVDSAEKKDKESRQRTIRRRLNEEVRKTATKYQLSNFLRTSAPSAVPTNGEDALFFDSKPIADLFLHATVLFADIAGFTAWSSVREPSQVFTLLETVFRAFDTIAKKRRVFKVETVGDCYVAVTGLPEPTKAHASLMAIFARECCTRFTELVGVLETTLGPDTGDLGIRIGMHSGTVTAGVLRGDKSRFQLFGDTVNTAARIESTGKRNRIHVSIETADLLGVAGKSHWLQKREHLVAAKGKGKLQTFWLLTKEEEKQKQMALTTTLNNKKLVDKTPEAPNATQKEETMKALLPGIDAKTYGEIELFLSPKMKRLCQWNTDILARLLKQIVTQRRAAEVEESVDFHEELSEREADIRSRLFVLDEVVEIIPLPGFDQHAFRSQQEDQANVELPECVIDQMKLYVASIALMYRNNPFHNYEHASHVMMSVSKLLSRIVAADDIMNKDENAADSHDLGWSIHDHTYGITSDPMTQFTVILAALIHDVDHTGASNAQLIKEGNELATVFRGKSVAEQNSTVLAWNLLMEERFHEFRRTIYAAPFELDRFRQLMTNTVLATDIMDKELQTLRRNRWDAAFSGSDLEGPEQATKDRVNRKATIVIEHLIQASDVSHTMQHWHIYCKWNERLFHEMAAAYKAGRLGFNPAEKWYEGEIGFYDNYVIPLAKKLKDCGVFGVASDEYLNYAIENRREWEEKGRQFVATLVERHMGAEVNVSVTEEKQD